MKYCLDCGFVGASKWKLRAPLHSKLHCGSFFVVPGVLYSAVDMVGKS